MELRLFTKEEVLNYVELNLTGDNDNYNKCDQESRYVPLVLFNIYVESFENSNPLFEVFSSTKYNARKIIPLRNELQKKLREIEEIHAQDIFVHYISQTFLGDDLLNTLRKLDENWKENWKYYHEKIIKVGEDLIDIIDECIANDFILWVIGL